MTRIVNDDERVRLVLRGKGEPSLRVGLVEKRVFVVLPVRNVQMLRVRRKIDVGSGHRLALAVHHNSSQRSGRFQFDIQRDIRNADLPRSEPLCAVALRLNS